ncbi:MAG: galactose-1-phosphate uridylyltransferase [Deltaproteobacteria bacterium]|nr:galactose-1-phosphate uridylyltransferase [Deltaproteobacteria bacterium]
MSELRQDPTTREWVIIATERRRRPHEFGSDFSSKKDNAANLQEYSKDCPFCSGNEYLSPHETASYRTLGTNTNSKGWWVRVIPNKFAALSLNFEENAQVYEGVRAVNPDFSGYFFPRATEVFRIKPGIGAHEVVIDTPRHNEQLPFFSDKQIQELFLMYRERYLNLRVNSKFKYIIIFKNSGANAGTSIVHSHSQIIATPIIPLTLRNNISQARFYYDEVGRCIFCDMIQAEIVDGRRIILQTADFIVFHPFASTSPFETWIMPLSHEPCFSNISIDKIKALAVIVKKILKGMYDALNDPDYNFVFNNPPIADEKEDYYHWSLRIIPRLTMKAGFEIGTGMSINTAVPEETAEFMRGFLKF